MLLLRASRAGDGGSRGSGRGSGRGGELGPLVGRRRSMAGEISVEEMTRVARAWLTDGRSGHGAAAWQRVLLGLIWA